MTLCWCLTCASFYDIETEAGEKAAKEEAVVENTTPDYAAGLVSAQVFNPTYIYCSLSHQPLFASLPS